MRKFFGPSGSVSRIVVESQVLKANILGDPTARAVDVYVPAGQDGGDRRDHLVTPSRGRCGQRFG